MRKLNKLASNWYYFAQVHKTQMEHQLYLYCPSDKDFNNVSTSTQTQLDTHFYLLVNFRKVKTFQSIEHLIILNIF